VTDQARNEAIFMLGQIDGKLDGVVAKQGEHTGKLSAIEQRLNKLETRAAVHGAVGGSVVAIGISLLVETVKRKLGGGA
jgi:hypothetical protein